jgi:gliding motility-associated-like protein
MYNLLLTLLFIFPCTIFHAQTLVMNEVSQGAAFNQEYVEFIVVDSTIVYDCSSLDPPCIDIRGWIFDDNSGYHGNSGIASGCVRFSFDPLWSCVPLGAIILIYNDSDQNPLVPATDISASDGNCSIVAPISDSNLFESNSTTPGAIACSYPVTGWTPGGDWSNTLLANGGDCARIVDLSGCEVFSVCWDDNNQNNQIYFQGGATDPNSATNTVYYFNGGDPEDQSNWSIGCADMNACGQEDQTPGVPNNTANANYIAQFNNNCAPITPVAASVVLNNDAVCLCNGSATVSGSGSIPGYTYEWLDDQSNPIGQTDATVTDLCGGNYQVIVTSSIGCDDTVDIFIPTTGSVQVDVSSVSVCEGDNVTLTAVPSMAGGDYNWSPNGETTNAITLTATVTSVYNVIYQLGSCSDNADATVTVTPIPAATFSAAPSAGSEPLEVTFSNTSLNGANYSWDFGDGTNTTTISSAPVLNTYNAGVYEVTLVVNNGPCLDSSTVLITVDQSQPPILKVPNVFTPDGNQLNDFFEIYTENIALLEGIIVNRWGQTMLEFNSIDFTWDGMFEDKEASEGTYFIKYRAIDFNENILEGYTFFNLIR